MKASLLAMSTIACSLAAHAAAPGTVAWRRQFAGPYASHRGAVAPDGTVYVQDVHANLYAYTPAGDTLWVYTPGPAPQPAVALAEGPVVRGADGALYISANPGGPDVQIRAVNPDGSLRWTFSDPGVTQGIIAGPAIGPDGNIYAVIEANGLGAISLDPSGALRWHETGSPAFLERGQLGAEISFGPGAPGADPDQFFLGFDMNGSGSGTGLLFALSLGGDSRFTAPLGGDANVGQFQPVAGPSRAAVYASSLVSSQGYRLRAFSASSGSPLWSYPGDSGPPTNMLSQPTVGPDGTIYVMRNLGEIHAVTPDGQNIWTHRTTFVLQHPVVSPDNSVVIVGGVVTFGQPGLVLGLDRATGERLWTINIPDEAGGHIIPNSRAWFSPDARRAYLTASIPSSSVGGWLYAIDLAAPTALCAGDTNGDLVVNFADLNTVLAHFGQSGPSMPGDLNADGVVNFADLNIVLGNFGNVC